MRPGQLQLPKVRDGRPANHQVRHHVQHAQAHDHAVQGLNVARLAAAGARQGPAVLDGEALKDNEQGLAHAAGDNDDGEAPETEAEGPHRGRKHAQEDGHHRELGEDDGRREHRERYVVDLLDLRGGGGDVVEGEVVATVVLVVDIVGQAGEVPEVVAEAQLGRVHVEGAKDGEAERRADHQVLMVLNTQVLVP